MTESAPKPSIFAQEILQVEEICRNKITNIELNNEDPLNKFAKLKLCKVTTRNGVVTSQVLVREIVIQYSESTANNQYVLKHPETDAVLGAASFAEFLTHVYSFATDVSEKEMERVALEAEKENKAREDLEKQLALQKAREDLAAEYRRKEAELENPIV